MESELVNLKVAVEQASQHIGAFRPRVLQLQYCILSLPERLALLTAQQISPFRRFDYASIAALDAVFSDDRRERARFRPENAHPSTTDISNPADLNSKVMSAHCSDRNPKELRVFCHELYEGDSSRFLQQEANEDEMRIFVASENLMKARVRFLRDALKGRSRRLQEYLAG